MTRRWMMAALGVVLVASSLVVGAQTAWAAVPAHGTASCPVLGGSGTVNPGLTPAGGPGGIKIYFSAKLGPVPGAVWCGGTVTSPAGDHVTGGSLTGSGYLNPITGPSGNSCVKFATGDKVGVITVTIKWTTTGAPIAPTVVVYKMLIHTVPVSGGHDTITLREPPLPGTATKSGSFAFPPAGTPNTTKLVTTLPGPGCGPGPWTAFKITAGGVSM